MGAPGSLPSPELLEDYSQFFGLLSEPARLQLLCQLEQGPKDVASLIKATHLSQSHSSRQLGQLQRAGLQRCTREGARTIWQVVGDLVDDLCALVQTRLTQRLRDQLAQLQAA
jgi:DNA-binding transcriptional ArsR family regulator